MRQESILARPHNFTYLFLREARNENRCPDSADSSAQVPE